MIALERQSYANFRLGGYTTTIRILKRKTVRRRAQLCNASVMKSLIESRLEVYRRLQPRHLRVLAVHFNQVPFELGEPSQSISLELLKEKWSGKIVLKFAGVQDLKTDGRIHPGMTCRLEIASALDRQLEGSRFYVSNDEPQDFEFHFYCNDFEIDELPIG